MLPPLLEEGCRILPPFMSSQEPDRVSKSALEPQEQLDFHAVYDAHLAWVCHALRRYSVAEKDVLDAAQNVFLVVYRKLPEFEGRSQVRTWLLQIVRRVASDYRRSAPVRREVFPETGHFEGRAAREASAEEAVDRSQHVTLARSILDNLPEGQRTVFIMYELEQLSGQQIAEELELPLGTVRSRLRLARETFKNEVRALTRTELAREVG